MTRRRHLIGLATGVALGSLATTMAAAQTAPSTTAPSAAAPAGQPQRPPASSEAPAEQDSSGPLATAEDRSQTDIAPADSGQADQGAPDPAADIIVTGTSIRGIEPAGSQTIQLDREAIAATGLTSVQEVARTLPQLQGLGFGDAPVAGQNGGGNTVRGTTLNLRGLGSSATLLLVNGHRLAPTGTAVTFTEANVVPVAALERIEVIADGASAIYGSDAVAGVVNYVLRRNYDGFEATGRYTTSRYWDQYGGNVLAGKTWDGVLGMGKGNLLVSYDYDHRNPFVTGRSPYLRQNLTRFGGLDGRLQGNNITVGDQGTISVLGTTPNTAVPGAGNFRYFTVPPGSTGAGLTAGSLLVNQPALADTADFSDYLAESTRHQVVGIFNQEITSWLNFGAQAFYTHRDTQTRSTVRATGTGQLLVTPASPFYIAGVPGVAPGAPLSVSYNFFKDIGFQIQDNPVRNITATGQFDVEFGGGWHGAASFTYGQDRACGACQPGKNVNVDAVQSLIARGIFNPFDTRPQPASVVAQFTGDNIQRSRNLLYDTVVKVDGPLIDLGAGSIRAALGGEFIRTSNYLINFANRGPTNATRVDTETRLERDIDAFFGELYVPVVAESMNVPLVSRFAIDAAVRTERYSDFGRTTNPKVGVEWTVVPGLDLRGSWGKSFRAPTLADVNPLIFSIRLPAAVVNNSGDTTIPIDVPGSNLTNILVVGGSNAALRPETAETYSFGADIKPTALPGFRASATYFNIGYENQIQGLFSQYTQFLANPANRQVFAPYVFATPTPAGCVPGDTATYNPIVTSYLGLANLFGPPITNGCIFRAVLDARNQNASTVKQDGIDGSINYDFETGTSRWSLGASASYILNVRIRQTANAQEVQRVNTVNYPIRFRSRGSASWSNGPVGVNLFLNYVGAYTNNLPITVAGVTRPIERVDGWATLDVGLVYSLPRESGALSGLRASINMQNLTNENPPIVLSTNGNALDNQNANPYGRIITFQLTKSF